MMTDVSFDSYVLPLFHTDMRRGSRTGGMEIKNSNTGWGRKKYILTESVHEQST